MTNATLTITAEAHGEAAVELFTNWHSDALLSVTDERLNSEPYQTTVRGLLEFLAESGYDLHGYTVGGDGPNGSYVRDRAGNIVIELAD